MWAFSFYFEMLPKGFHNMDLCRGRTLTLQMSNLTAKETHTPHFYASQFIICTKVDSSSVYIVYAQENAVYYVQMTF